MIIPEKYLSQANQDLQKRYSGADFFVDEFVTPLTIERLCKVITNDNYFVTLEAAINTLDWLNKLLIVSNFYDILHKIKPNSSFSKNITDLIDKTREYRKKGFPDLNTNEQINIKRLNRLLLEETYPHQTPKRIITQAKQDLQERYRGNLFLSKMNRLHTDLSSFNDDISFLGRDKQNKIIYVADYTEILAYQIPEQKIKYYLYDIEEDDLLMPGNSLYNQKVIRRWYRLRELFFNKSKPTIVFPSHWEEVENDIAFLSQVLLNNNETQLKAIINTIKQADIPKKRFKEAEDALVKIETGLYSLTEDETLKLNELLSEYSLNIAALTFDRKYKKNVECETRFKRLSSLLKDGNLEDIASFDWVKYAGIDSGTADKIKSINLELHKEKINQLAEFFNISSGKTKTRISNFIDAQALVFIHEINSLLSENNYKNIQLQMVTSSLTMFNIDHVLPDNYLCARVRHPKLLAGCLNLNNDVWQEVKNDLSYIMTTIDAFLQKFKDTDVKKQDEVAKDMRSEISSRWQNLENAMFVREIAESEKSPSSELILQDKIMVENKKNLMEKFMNYLQSGQKGFDNYFHQTFRVVFEELVNAYLLKFLSIPTRPEKPSIPVEKLTATFYDLLVPLRFRLESEHIRNIMELNNGQVIQKITDGINDGKKLGEILKEMINGDIKFDNDFELKFLKALTLATAGNWKMVKIMCDYALEDKSADISHHEAYFLRSLAHRRLVFESVSQDDTNKAREHFTDARADIEAAVKEKERNGRRQDVRYRLAESAMQLEVLCYPVLMEENIGKDTVRGQISNCETLLNNLESQDGEYNKYMTLRCLQILLSYYLADLSGMIKDEQRSSFDWDLDKVKYWFNKLEFPMGKKEEFGSKNIYRGVSILKRAGELIFDFDTMAQDRCESVFNEIYQNCLNLSAGGFFRQLTHRLKQYLLKKILSKYSVLQDKAVEKWPKVFSDMASST